MAAFVTVSEMEDVLQRILNSDAATAALDAACDIIRDYLHQELDLVADDTVALDGTGRCTLLLPELPVVAVSTVEIDGDPVDGDEWAVDFAGVLNRKAAQWPAGIGNVEVTYTHGYANIPDRFKRVAISLASRLYHDGPRDPGIRSEQLAAYSYVREPGTAAGDLTGLERWVLDRGRIPRVPVA